MTAAEKRQQWKDPEIQRLLMDLKIYILTRYLHHRTTRAKKKAPTYVRGPSGGKQRGRPLLEGRKVGVSVSAVIQETPARRRLAL